MPYVELSDKAGSQIRDLVVERNADDDLIDRLTEQLEAIAEQPATRTEPAKYPYAANRLMANFKLNDASAKRWSFGVTLRRMPDEDGIYILTVNGAPLPASFDD